MEVLGLCGRSGWGLERGVVGLRDFWIVGRVFPVLKFPTQRDISYCLRLSFPFCSYATTFNLLKFALIGRKKEKIFK